MHPPGWVCKALYRMHPYVRLAWQGRAQRYAGELNPGSFCLVQLYHVSDAGRFDEPLQYKEFWDVQPVLTPNGGVDGKRAERGPIFNRNGGTRRDWPAETRIPIFVANLEDFGFPMEEVLSGRFLLDIWRWFVPIKRRVAEDARAAGRQLDRDADAIAREMTDHLWKEANKSDATSQPIAYKHAKQELRAWDNQEKLARKLPDYYLPPDVSDE